MERWTCPKCEREFGRTGQGHMCNPGLSLEEYFADAAAWERPVYDRVAAHLTTLGDVIIDPIAIGILFKNGPMFCELRAMKKWVALGFYLRRRLISNRLSRKVIDHRGSSDTGKYFHVINVDDPALIDDEVLAWLTESYHHAAAKHPGGTDPMVPDDIDDPFAG